MSLPATSALLSPWTPIAREPREPRCERLLARCAAGVRTLSLSAGKLVPIVKGAGIVVRVRSGVLWITEQGSMEDIVLRGGEAHRISSVGVTIIEAHTQARFALDASVMGPAKRRMTALARSGAALRERFALLLRLAGEACAALAHARARPVRPRAFPGGEHDAQLPDAVRHRLRTTSLYPYF